MGVEGRIKGYYRRYIFIIRCDVENGMLYNVECLWPGWTAEYEGVQNGVVKTSVWYEMVA